MKKKCLALIATLCMLINHNTFATLQQDIDRMIVNVHPPIHVGVVVHQADTGKILYEHVSQYLFSPASIQKVLTATAALIALGKDFRFRTELLTNGTTKGHVLNGNVLIKFSGDPELTSDDLQQLLDTLASQGVKKIQGNIYIDSSTYDSIPYPPGWLWDDLSYSYAAPLSAVNINKNKFILHLTPGKNVGEQPTLSSSLPSNVAHFNNHVTTIARYNKQCPLTIYSDFENDFSLHGCISKKEAGRWNRSLAVRNTIPLAAAIIHNSLANNGISYTGKIVTGVANNQYRVLNTHYSVTLQNLLKHMLKKSDNLISDSLLKQLGYYTFRTQGTWLNGKKALEKILHEATRMSFDKVLIDDGAGMSRYNLITPNHFVALLDYIYKQPESFRHVLIDALPIGGIDGTLIGRFYNQAAEKRIHAKTGSMTGVSSLTGYIYSRHLGILSFSIMVNGFVGKARPYRNFEDKICEYLVNYHGMQHG
ncbi:MAG: D-alanyl-D-alanine carboxypeptidase/D-alanyl-D-alanine-endopeptidase [Coxiella sp. RIFCSPHIGHO2_12_FULL_42_15]|nr:MAG: D-alanyl-D-alanine carboxypeptidase/D-alanyl-D-alanine-endopeptidase [Coxiella sp. RIFCSPHIGHO2_12_FULL_42_15]